MAVRTITRSLRFNDDDSAYLSRTPGSAGNQKSWTFSAWLKPCKFGGQQPIFCAYVNPTNYALLTFSANAFIDATDSLKFNTVNANITISRLETTALFRDPSAWYHIVAVADTPNATSTDRMRLYVNGVRITSFSASTYPSQNADIPYFNTTTQQQIGSLATGTYGYHDGYMTEIHFLDGQALDASAFGELDGDGVWQPKDTSFSSTQYGLNGFYLPFTDNTSTITLGNDIAPTGTGHTAANNWTLNNFSVAAGAGNDSLVDTPSNNYCTLNALRVSTATLSNGQLDAVMNNAATKVLGTFGMTSGKWYWECSFTNMTANGAVGIATEAAATNTHVGNDATSWSYVDSTGNKNNNASASAYGSTWTTGDVIGVAFDADIGSLFFYKNGVAQNSGVAAFTGLTSGPYFPAFGDNSAGASSTLWVNFGQRPFAYTPPGGFVALNTANLPTPAIVNPEQHFNVKLYTGTAAVADLTDFGYTPDLVWIKNRTSSSDHVIIDSTRTRNGLYPYLSSNQTTKERLVTGQTHIDQSPDTPTVNYPVINSHATVGNTATVMADGNLQVTDTSGSATWKTRFASYSMPTGKWYAEFLVNYTGAGSFTGTPGSIIGLHNGGDDTYIGSSTATYGYGANGSKYNNGGTAFGATYTNGDIISVAYDADAGRVWFGLNGVWQASGDPATGANPAYSGVPAGLLFGVSVYWVTPDGNTHILCNFGARPFVYTPPTGFVSLNDSTIPDPVIKLPKQYFNIKLFTGTGTAAEYTDLGFTPDLAWIKTRSTTSDHFIFDSVRTAGNRISGYLSSNLANAQRIYASSPNYDDIFDTPGNATDNLSWLSGDNNMTLTYGNTYGTPTVNTGWSSRQGMIPFSSGKWYAEFQCHGITAGAQGNPFVIGLVPIGNPFTGNGQQLGASGRGYGFALSDSTGSNILRLLSGSSASIGQAYVTAGGDTFMMAVDLNTGQMWVGKNGGWMGGDPASGTGAHLTGVPAGTYLMGLSIYRDSTYTGNVMSVNYGHTQFNYAPPAGFKPLTSHNLPALTNSQLHMRGNAPDLVWLKSRSAATDHMLVDRVRGMSINLSSNAATAEYAAASVMEMSKFGVRLSSNSNTNTGGATYVAYAWKEGVTPGFDIVTRAANVPAGPWTNDAVPHNLGVTPAMIISFLRDGAGDTHWVWHQSFTATEYVPLQTTAAKATNSNVYNGVSSTTFTRGASTSWWGTGSYVFYLFAEVPGFSRFGAYNGNANASGPFIYCGFKPAFVMIKNVTLAGNGWIMMDNLRNPTNPTTFTLYPAASGAETNNSTYAIDATATGFKVRATDPAINGSGSTMIYAAFAEAPFQYANAE